MIRNEELTLSQFSPYAMEFVYKNIIPKLSLRFFIRKTNKHLTLNMSEANFITFPAYPALLLLSSVEIHSVYPG